MNDTENAASVKTLLSPVEIAGLQLPNRVVMAPMSRYAAVKGVLHKDAAPYYARRAASGVAMIITEATAIDHPTASNHHGAPHLWGEEAIAAWRDVVDQVHGSGGVISAQLWHGGGCRLGEEPNANIPASSPSGLMDRENVVGEPLSLKEIEEIIVAFAKSAAVAESLGFDALEIHGAHGYLIDQFLWDATNRRTDHYGGDLSSRSRFAAEVVAACKQATGGRLPIFFRFSQWKQQDFTVKLASTPEELAQILEPIAEAGADAIHCSMRRYWEPEFEGSSLNLAAWAKKITGLRSVCVGSVGLNKDMVDSLYEGQSAASQKLDRLFESLSLEEYDLVAVGRAMLSDHQWFSKVCEGREAELKPFNPEDLATIY